ncbi:hypothetical protein MCHI_000071 [Candidatus Magnetoovum chiemensis]|nr:hypothetical protein MCHI_000071 [Candidatus Magnetoovum chiemensis]
MEELKILLFKVDDLSFAIDMDQIKQMTYLDSLDKEKYSICRLNDKLPFKGHVIYKCPKALLIKENPSDNSLNCALIIDEPADVINIPIDKIQQMPKIFRIREDKFPIWGVFIYTNSIVMLVDFYRLAAYNYENVENLKV